jgi:hypothetical protein
MKWLPHEGQSSPAGGKSPAESIEVSQCGQWMCMMPRLSHNAKQKSRDFPGDTVDDTRFLRSNIPGHALAILRLVGAKELRFAAQRLP